MRSRGEDKEDVLTRNGVKVGLEVLTASRLAWISTEQN